MVSLRATLGPSIDPLAPGMRGRLAFDLRADLVAWIEAEEFRARTSELIDAVLDQLFHRMARVRFGNLGTQFLDVRRFEVVEVDGNAAVEFFELGLQRCRE